MKIFHTIGPEWSFKNEPASVDCSADEARKNSKERYLLGLRCYGHIKLPKIAKNNFANL